MQIWSAAPLLNHSYGPINLAPYCYTLTKSRRVLQEVYHIHILNAAFSYQLSARSAPAVIGIYLVCRLTFLLVQSIDLARAQSVSLSQSNSHLQDSHLGTVLRYSKNETVQKVSAVLGLGP